MVLPEFSKSAVVRKFGAPVNIEEVPIPREIEPGAILTRIEMCSICGTDVHLWQGSLATKITLPIILGHEMVGRILALGTGPTRDSPTRNGRETAGNQPRSAMPSEICCCRRLADEREGGRTACFSTTKPARSSNGRSSVVKDFKGW